MGDFNVIFTGANLAIAFNKYVLNSLKKEPVCFKSFLNPS